MIDNFQRLIFVTTICMGCHTKDLVLKKSHLFMNEAQTNDPKDRQFLLSLKESRNFSIWISFSAYFYRKAPQFPGHYSFIGEYHNDSHNFHLNVMLTKYLQTLFMKFYFQVK